MHREINDISKDTWEVFPWYLEHLVTKVPWLLKLEQPRRYHLSTQNLKFNHESFKTVYLDYIVCNAQKDKNVALKANSVFLSHITPNQDARIEYSSA